MICQPDSSLVSYGASGQRELILIFLHLVALYNGDMYFPTPQQQRDRNKLGLTCSAITEFWTGFLTNKEVG